MIALLPILLTEQNFLHEKRLKTLRARILQLEALSEIEEIKIFTNLENVSFFSTAQHSTIVSNFKCTNNQNIFTPKGLLPHGTFTALEKLYKDSEEPSELIVIDITHEAFDANAISQAIRCYQKYHPKAVVSVCQNRKNPCQMNSYLRVINVGLVHILEEQTHLSVQPWRRHVESGLKISLPFYFDWQRHGVGLNNHGKIFVPKVTNDSITYHEVEGEIAPEYTGGLGFETPQTARVIWANKPDSDLFQAAKNLCSSKITVLGASLSGDFREMDCVLLQFQGDNALYLFTNKNKDARGAHFLNIFPLFPSKENNVFPCQSIPALELTKCMGFRIEEIHPLSSFSFTILAETVEGTYDIQEPFMPEIDLWHIDKILNRHINAQTGKEIRGRQDFPTVLSPDGVFCISTQNTLANIDKVLLAGEAYGFEHLQQETKTQLQVSNGLPGENPESNFTSTCNRIR